MTTKERKELKELANDWELRAHGLRVRAQRLKRKDYTSQAALETVKTDYQAQAVAYIFAAMDLKLKIPE